MVQLELSRDVAWVDISGYNLTRLTHFDLVTPIRKVSDDWVSGSHARWDNGCIHAG